MFSTTRARREAQSLAAKTLQNARLEAAKARREAQEVLGEKLLRDKNTPEYNLFLDYRKVHNPNRLVPDITWDIYDYMTPDEKILLAPDVPRYAMEIPKKMFKDVIKVKQNQTTKGELT